jgi:hypothetical protein
MKITKTQLKQIIKEEISKILSENDKCQAVRREWEKAIPGLYGGQGGAYDEEGEEDDLIDWMREHSECFETELAELDAGENPMADFLARTSTNKGPMTHAQRMATHQGKIQDS